MIKEILVKLDLLDLLDLKVIGKIVVKKFLSKIINFVGQKGEFGDKGSTGDKGTKGDIGPIGMY